MQGMIEDELQSGGAGWFRIFLKVYVFHKIAYYEIMTPHERKSEKLRNAILYFIRRDKTVGLTKLMKLLYYLDFTLYKECGESLSGQQYSAWPFWPVPVDVWAELHEKKDAGLNLSRVVKIIPVQKDPKDEAAGIRLKTIPRARFSDLHFTGRELKKMKELSETFMGVPAAQIVQASHQRGDPWDITIRSKGERAPIDYELALAELPEEEKNWALETQKDTEFFDNLFS